MRLSLVLLLMSWFLMKFHLMGAVLITLVGMVIAKILAIVRIRTLLGTTGIGVLPWKTLQVFWSQLVWLLSRAFW